jgi:hypothetical protein
MLQWGVAQIPVERRLEGVAEHLVEQAGAEMPQVLSPHLLDVEALDELAKCGLNPVANTTRDPAASRGRIVRRGAVRSQRRHSLWLEPPGQFRQSAGTTAHGNARHALDQIRQTVRSASLAGAKLRVAITPGRQQRP